MLLKMLTSLSGPDFCLSPGDEHEFEGDLVDGEITGEAGRLIAAEFAEPVEVEGTPTTPDPAVVVEPIVEQVDPVVDAPAATTPARKKKAD